MTKKDFVKWLGDFLVDIELTEAQKSRIEAMLDRLDPKIVKETKKIYAERKVFVTDPLRFRSEMKKSLLAIAREVKAETGFSLFMLRSKNRETGLVKARVEFIRKAILDSDASLKEIGRYIDRDHSTIVHHRNNLYAKIRRREVK